MPQHFFDLSVCSDSSKLSVNMIAETCEICSFQSDVFKQDAFCSPGGNDVSCDFSSTSVDGGEMVTSHDGRLTSSIWYDECSHGTTLCNGECSHGTTLCNGECSHGTTLFSIDECVFSSTNSIEFVSCTTSTSCCQYELCTLCKLDDQDHYNRCVFSWWILHV